LIANREFLTFSDFWESDKEKGVWYCVSVSIDAPLHDTSCVRAENKFAIQKWAEIEGGKSELTVYTQIVMGGWLPQYIIDKSVMGAPLKMLALNDLL
jgi:hypothetical protein